MATKHIFNIKEKFDEDDCISSYEFHEWTPDRCKS